MDTEFPQAPPQRRRAHRFWNGILTGCLSGGERASARGVASLETVGALATITPRAEGVERRFAAPLELLRHVFLDHVHGQLAATWFNLGKTFQIQLA